MVVPVSSRTSRELCSVWPGRLFYYLEVHHSTNESYRSAANPFRQSLSASYCLLATASPFSVSPYWLELANYLRRAIVGCPQRCDRTIKPNMQNRSWSERTVPRWVPVKGGPPPLDFPDQWPEQWVTWKLSWTPTAIKIGHANDLACWQFAVGLYCV